MGITPQQFEQMRKRLGSAARTSLPVPATTLSVDPMLDTTRRHQIVLGVDPSLRGTGFGIIKLARPTPLLLTQGTIRCPARWERSRCLLQIARDLREAIQKFHPTVCAIEGLFFAQNLQTALLLGEARGAALVVLAEAGLEIYEMAPRKVKQAIVGYGAAQKLAVAKMVQRMLRLSAPPAPDAADALALALAHAQESGRYSLTPRKRI